MISLIGFVYRNVFWISECFLYIGMFSVNWNVLCVKECFLRSKLIFYQTNIADAHSGCVRYYTSYSALPDILKVFFVFLRGQNLAWYALNLLWKHERFEFFVNLCQNIKMPFFQVQLSKVKMLRRVSVRFRNSVHCRTLLYREVQWRLLQCSVDGRDKAISLVCSSEQYM